MLGLTDVKDTAAVLEIIGPTSLAELMSEAEALTLAGHGALLTYFANGLHPADKTLP